MHILTLVYFKAKNGGLHENVKASVKASLEAGHKCTVVCKPGPFSAAMLRLGANVIHADFSKACFRKVIREIKKLHDYQPIDIIHSHPFASREIGVLSSQIMGVPIVTSVHGRYLDGIPDSSQNYDKIITVSDGIGHYLIENGLSEPQKLFTSPNTPDSSLFRVKNKLDSGRSEKVRVALVSRLDSDKQFVLDTFMKVVEHAAKVYPAKIVWDIVGEGGQASSLKSQLEKLSGSNEYYFWGWLEGDDLYRAYSGADIAIVPGRCALEAMSCGTAVISLGSKGYSGVIGPRNWQSGVYSNFGGLGYMEETYDLGSIEEDFDLLMRSSGLRSLYGYFGSQLIDAFFNQTKVNKELLNLYAIVSLDEKMRQRPRVSEKQFLALQVITLVASRKGNKEVFLKVESSGEQELTYAWYVLHNGVVVQKILYEPKDEITISLEEDGEYEFHSYIKNKEDEKLSFVHSTCVITGKKIHNLRVETSEPQLTIANKNGSVKCLKNTGVSEKLNFNL